MLKTAVSLVGASKGSRMKIKQVTEGVLSDIYKATQRQSKPISGPAYNYEIPSDTKMDTELFSQVKDLALAYDSRLKFDKAKAENAIANYRALLAREVNPEKRQELAKRFAGTDLGKKFAVDLAKQQATANVTPQQKAAAELARQQATVSGIPAGTEVTAPGGVIITKGKDGAWYDPDGAQVVNSNDIKQLNARAKSKLAARAGIAQTKNIPTQIPPVRVEPRKRGIAK